MVTCATTIEGIDDPSSLIDLCHHRWGIPILAELQRSAGGAKFIAIQSALGLSRDALSRTLGGLMDLDLVLRNPGYGHPMRPEYLLSPSGEDAGPASLILWGAIKGERMEATAGRKWSLPVLWALSRGAERFSSAQRSLYTITPRALTLALRDLETEECVVREVTDERPPGVRYSLTDRGRRIADLTEDLAASLQYGR